MISLHITHTRYNLSRLLSYCSRLSELNMGNLYISTLSIISNPMTNMTL